MALARVLVNFDRDVMVWSALPAKIDELSSSRRHKNLPGMVIPESITFTKSIEEVADNKDIILCAIPSTFVRLTINAAKGFIKPGQNIVDVAKCIKPDTLYTMTQIISDVMLDAKIVALSGPTHAEQFA